MRHNSKPKANQQEKKRSKGEENKKLADISHQHTITRVPNPLIQ
jgi:hypothetical protein